MILSGLWTRSGTPSLNLQPTGAKTHAWVICEVKKGKLPVDQILILSTDSLVHAQHSTLPTKPERNGEYLLSAWPEEQVSYWWRHCSRAWELWKMLSQGEREIPHGKCNKDIRIGENFNWKEVVLYMAQWWDLCSECEWNLRGLVFRVSVKSSDSNDWQFWRAKWMSNFRIRTSVQAGQKFSWEQIEISMTLCSSRPTRTHPQDRQIQPFKKILSVVGLPSFQRRCNKCFVNGSRPEMFHSSWNLTEIHASRWRSRRYVNSQRLESITPLFRITSQKTWIIFFV